MASEKVPVWVVALALAPASVQASVQAPVRVLAPESVRGLVPAQALASLPHEYTVFVHLRQPGGGNVAQADHRPLDHLYPTTLWPVGETIRESSQLALPAELPPGSYDLWVGFYRLETGERLPGLFAAGECVGGIHGAVRIGACAVLDCLVNGRKAA